MGLGVLVALVVIGVSLIVAAVHFTGGTKRAAIRDADHARALFDRDFPDIPTAAADLTTDRENAFLLLPGNNVGIVHVVGDGYLTRLVSAADIAQIELREPATLSLRFRDFTWTGGHFTFFEPAAARQYALALKPATARISEGA